MLLAYDFKIFNYLGVSTAKESWERQSCLILNENVFSMVRKFLLYNNRGLLLIIK